MTRLAIVAFLFLFLLPAVGGACGDAPSELADPAPCPVPTPLPVSRQGGVATGGAYRQSFSRGVDRLEELLLTFRNRWPEGKFSRAAEFRTDFARYSDDSVCIARSLTGLGSLTPAYDEFASAFGTATAAFIKAQGEARDAVKSRNVSGYRDWNKAVDDQLHAMGAATSTMPPLPTRFPQ